MEPVSLGVAARMRARGLGLWAVVSLVGVVGACGERAGQEGSATAAGTATAGQGTSGATGAATGTGDASASSAASASVSASSSASGSPGAGASRCPEGMVLVPGGRFRMGSSAEDKDADPDERPVREVTLRPYCMGRTEVTVAEYEKCVAGPRGDLACPPASTIVVSFGLKPVDVLFWSKFCNAGRKDAGAHPVNCADWRQAVAYCKWAGGRLPTEAEWEFAARGPEGRKYPWGDDPPSAERLNACGAECAAGGAALGRRDKKTMYSGDDGAEATAPVGRYPAGASPFGLLDMAGNVWEWTADSYAPYDPAATDNPLAPVPAPAPGQQGKGSSVARVVRGGHWLNAGERSPRAANRESRGEEKKLEDVGFRCAADPSP